MEKEAKKGNCSFYHNGELFKVICLLFSQKILFRKLAFLHVYLILKGFDLAYRNMNFEGCFFTPYWKSKEVYNKIKICPECNYKLFCF